MPASRPFLLLSFAFYSTVTLAAVCTEPEMAVMTALPWPVLITKPEGSTTATAGSEDCQVNSGTECVLESLKVPRAVRLLDWPRGIDVFAGIIVRAVRLPWTTVSVVVANTVSVRPSTGPNMAVIMVVPDDLAVALPSPSTTATVGFDDVQ